MNCPNCGVPSAAGDVFCGNCGAQLGQQAADATQEMPAQQAAQQPTKPTQQMPAQPGGPVGSGGAVPPPPPAGGKGWIIALAILLVLALCSCAGLGGWFYYVSQIRDVVEEPTSTVEPTATTTPTDTTTPSSSGYPSAEDAVKAELPVDWVYQLAADTPDLVEFWVGPPASEWDSVYIVERGTDGSWSVTEVQSYSAGFDDEAVVGPAGEAQGVVEQFLEYIMNDQPNEAHMLAISPFADDPVSAEYANGDFYSYQVDDILEQGDGTFWIHTTQEWADGTRLVDYYVVPTELGYYINDVYYN